MAERALVTGVPGWLGTRLARALRDGIPRVGRAKELPPAAHVRALSLPETLETATNALEGVEVVSGDLRDPASLRALLDGAEGATLYHAAGVIHPKRAVRELFAVNVAGTRNLLEAARAAGVRRLVFVSSNSPAGVRRDPDAVFREGDPDHPHMMYGRSKQRAEALVREAGARGDLETVIVRAPWFYGPGQPARQTLFFAMIRDGVVPVVGSGENRRSMAYIGNLCQGLLLAGRVSAAAGQTYWIADQRPYTMNEVVDTVERLLETEFATPVAHKRRRLPGFTAEVALGVDWTLQHLGLYHQKIHVLSEMNKTIACSVERAQRELGYAPTVELEEGMRRSLAWVMSRGGLPT
jgi:nucleoside-diphosphate-sugar epimerase